MTQQGAGHWMTKAGYPAALSMSPLQTINGYIGVPVSHPWYGKDYDTIDADVHGGLTFAALGAYDSTKTDIHWWIGFDTCHVGDALPGREHLGGVVRTEAYVREECERLAKQAAAVLKATPAR